MDKKKSYFLLTIVSIIPIALLFTFIFNLFFLSAPKDFETNITISANNGETLSGVSQILTNYHLIKYQFFFKSFLVFFAGTKGLVAGDYYFDKPENVITVAWRLSHGSYDLKNEKITVPEGLNVKEIATLFIKNKNFTNFKPDEFIALATPHEGYLFPDTYFFLPNIDAQGVIKAMLANFKSRVGQIDPNVLKMASILEKEARTEETRRIIAGILWKRLSEGMLLQVDATIVYATGKEDGNKLTSDDFKIDSPYNTYIYKGLPPTPISNPGLDTINAALKPLATQYYYYLTDQNGGFHPAVTYAEHLMNKEQYLK